jgi:hypothetical protein
MMLSEIIQITIFLCVGLHSCLKSPGKLGKTKMISSVCGFIHNDAYIQFELQFVFLVSLGNET